MFAPWRSHNPVRITKSPITGKSLIPDPRKNEKQKSNKNKSWLVEKCWRHGSRFPTRDRRRYFFGGWDTQEPTRGVYSRRVSHLGNITTASLLRHFKKVHMNFHQFFFHNFSSVETYHLFKRKKLVKNHEYRIKYFKFHVLYDKQTIQNFVPFEKSFSYEWFMIPVSVCPFWFLLKSLF